MTVLGVGGGGGTWEGCVVKPSSQVKALSLLSSLQCESDDRGPWFGRMGEAYSEPVTWILIIKNHLNMTKTGCFKCNPGAQEREDGRVGRTPTTPFSGETSYSSHIKR